MQRQFHIFMLCSLLLFLFLFFMYLDFGVDNANVLWCVFQFEIQMSKNWLGDRRGTEEKETHQLDLFCCLCSTLS